MTHLDNHLHSLIKKMKEQEQFILSTPNITLKRLIELQKSQYDMGQATLWLQNIKMQEDARNTTQAKAQEAKDASHPEVTNNPLTAVK